MQAAFPYRILEQQLWLSADRTIFWEEEKTLITSDCHFGKTGHFRKSGLAVPQAVYKEDLQRLVSQIQYFQPSQIIIVGDFFHSKMNKELELLCPGNKVGKVDLRSVEHTLVRRVCCKSTASDLRSLN